MSKYNLIIKSFGMQAAKVLTYNVLPRQYPATSGSDFEEIEGETVEADATSVLGTPVFAPITLSNEDESLSITLDAVLCEMSENPHMVKTVVAGRKSTVKEFVTGGDWSISLKGGLFSGQADVYPAEDMSILREITEPGNIIKISSEFVQQFDVYNAVVVSRNFPQKRASYNTQLFNIKLLSDEPIELNEDTEL